MGSLAQPHFWSLVPILSYISVFVHLFPPFLNEEFWSGSQRGLWVSRFMRGQDSISVHVLPLLSGKKNRTCVLSPNWCAPWLPPSCPGLVSAQLLEERPSNTPPVPAQHLLLPCLLPCQVFEPFLHQSKELASGGSGKEASCG